MPRGKKKQAAEAEGRDAEGTPLVPPQGGKRGGGAVVHIACSEDPATGTQRGSLAFRGGTGEGATAASGSGQAVAAFDAFFSVTP